SARDAAGRVPVQIARLRNDLSVPNASLDKIVQRAAALQRDVEQQLSASNTLSRAIEGFSALPTTDQHRQIDWAFDDAARTVDDVNRFLQKEVPALYSDLLRRNSWPPQPRPITPPVKKW